MSRHFITLVVFIGLILITQPCQAVTKCYKDICVGDNVLVINGIYKGNYVRIWDIIKEETSDEDEEQVRDYYKYFVSFNDGSIMYLYRDQLNKEK
jgi:hypothetical protein